MSKLPDVNKNVPQPGSPAADVTSLAVVVTALKQGVESLAGYRGGLLNRAVTYNDLVSLGLVSATTVQSQGGRTDYVTAEALAAGGTGGSLAAETAARIAADTAESVARNTADASEAATRAAADTAEITARTAAVSAEATARAAADTSEATTRAAADASLQTQINNLVLSARVFSALPGSPTAGQLAIVTDSPVVMWGATAAGGGSNRILAWYDGTHWVVVGRPAFTVVTVTTATTLAAGTHGLVVVANGTAAPLTVTLPSAPVVGQEITVKDLTGNAATYSITITAGAGLIDGYASYTMTFNFESVSFVWNGTGWSIV